MKKLMMMAAVAFGTAFCSWGAVTLDGTTLRIAGETGLLNAVLSGDYAAYYAALKDNDGTITAVAVSAKSSLTLTEDLEYTGSWSIVASTVTLGVNGSADPTYPLGKGTDENARITINTDSAQIEVATHCNQAVIDAPITVVGAAGVSIFNLAGVGTEPITKLTVNGSITINSAVQQDFFLSGNKVALHTHGGISGASGIDASLSLTGANGAWYVYDNPVTLKKVYFSWLAMYVEVAGNTVGTFDFNGGGGKLFLDADGAISGAVSEIKNLKESNSCIYLRTDDAFAFKMGTGNTASTPGILSSSGKAPTLVLAGDTDVTFLTPVGANIAIKKQGTGKLTFTGTIASTKTLTVEAGTAAFASGSAWAGCKGITLAGGKVEIADTGIFPTTMTVSVADGTAASQMLLPSGTMQIKEFFKKGISQNPVTYGSSASEAVAKLAIFDAASTGILAPTTGGTPIDVAIASGATKKIAEVLSADDLAKLNNDEYTIFNKTGDGTLELDQALTYGGTWNIGAGCVNVTAAANAFGTTGDYLQPIKLAHSAGAYLNFAANDIVVDRPIEVTASKYAGTGAAALRWNQNLGTLTLNGKISCTGGNLTMIMRTGTTLYTKGGIEALDYGVIGAGAGYGSQWWIQETPIKVAAIDLNAVRMHFDVAGNEVGTLVVEQYAYFYVEQDDAFTGRPKVQFSYKDSAISGMDRGNIDIKGHDVAFDLDQASSYGYGIRNSAVAAATLDLGTTKASTTCYGYGYVGNMSIVKSGENEIAFATNILAVGSLTVTGGKFSMAAGSQWAGCPNVTVSGSASVAEINAGETFPENVTVALNDGGTMSIVGAGTVQKAAALYFGSDKQTGGTWGSEESVASNKSANFLGAGILDVMLNKGFLITIQ